MPARTARLLTKIWANPIVQFICVAIIEHFFMYIKHKATAIRHKTPVEQPVDNTVDSIPLESEPKAPSPRERNILYLDGCDRTRRKKLWLNKIRRKQKP